MSTATISYIGPIAADPRAARPRTARPRAERPVRLTRRGQVAVLTAALLVLAVLVVALGSSGTATDVAGAEQPTRTVQVVAGQTLWQIAAEANPTGDIRTTVDEIVRLNSLSSASALQLGSTIAVPVYR